MHQQARRRIQVGRIDDVWSNRKPTPECFSDGVGIITTRGMQQAVESHPGLKRAFLRTGQLPAAIQVRIAGAKGMLTRWDHWCARPRSCACIAVSAACRARA